MNDNGHRPEQDGLVTAPLRSEESLGDLFSAMTSDLSLLVRQEIELAKVEFRDEAKRAGSAAAMFGVAGVGAWMAVLFVSLALAWLLDQGLNTALSFAVVGVVWAIVGGVLGIKAKHSLAALRPLPQTVETLKEDVQWTKAQMS